jgi:D-specific alpha-keto acid dehydrogenase
MGMTIYGCERDEAALFREMAPRLGVIPTITEAAVSVDNIDLARGNGCISVGHKTRIADPTLLALSQAGVTHISTRSIGYNHLNLSYAESVGISVQNVVYSPDSVADFTLMLILMAVRNAKSMIRRVDARDYRLEAVRGKELRDLAIGVIGVGRIGAAVIDRLQGFGCRVVAYDPRPGAATDAAPLVELLRQSDVVTLHTPLDAGTHHLLDGPRIAQMKQGSYVVNTGRGALDVLEGEEGIFYRDCRRQAVRSELLLRLQAMPNVVISPHTAYYTDHALRDTVENSILNCLEFESGRQDG